MVFKSVQEKLVGTSSTTILTGDGDAGNYLVYLYARLTAAATVTSTVTWTDVTGSQVDTIMNGAYPAGSFGLAPIYVNAAAAGNVAIASISDTANAIWISASIKRL